MTKQIETSRYQQLLAFLQANKITCSKCDPCDCGNECAGSLQPLNGDASFRRYYRLQQSNAQVEALCYQHKTYLQAPDFFTESLIIVDAPSATQKNREFVAINHILSHAQLLVPSIICSDLDSGFMVQEDLGNTLFWDKLAKKTPEQQIDFYKLALLTLNNISALPLNYQQLDRVAQARNSFSKMSKEQQAAYKPRLARYELDSTDLKFLGQLPPFDDAFIRMELEIFTQWCLDKALHLTISDQEQKILERSFSYLSEQCRSQEQVAMHRDFHSRNLMVLEEDPYAFAEAVAKAAPHSIEPLPTLLAVLDYQDMVLGPIGYDIASLLYDCYITITSEQRDCLLHECYDNYRLNGLLQNVTFTDFTKQVKLCAIQRHIKVLGIFNRLHLRDGKDGYLKYLLGVLQYIEDNCADIAELQDLRTFLQQRVRPALASKAMGQ